MQGIQNAAIAMSQDWLSEVSLIGWGVAHPVWAIGGLAVLLFLLSGLLRAITQLAEKLWIALLRSPLNLIRWMFTKLRQFFKIEDTVPVSMNKSTKHPHYSYNETQVWERISRLEEIQKEQIQILKEVKALLNKEPPPPMN